MLLLSITDAKAGSFTSLWVFVLCVVAMLALGLGIGYLAIRIFRIFNKM